jgi:hypothetical protein
MMKFLKNGLLFALVGAFVLTACDPAEDETPVGSAPNVTVSVENEQDVYLPGDVIDLVVDFTADDPVVGATINAETEEFILTFDATGISNNVIDLNEFDVASSTEGSFTISGIQIPNEFANQTLTFTIEMEDSEERSGQGTLDIEIGEASTPLISYTEILVYAPAADGSTNTWFSTNLGETVTEAEVNAGAAPNSVDVDFGYYYGANTDFASIASPNAYSVAGIDISDWNTRNATEFKLTTISGEEYLEITSSEDLAAVWDREDNINEGETITNLEVGDVVAFQLDPDNKDGLYGVFRVIDIEPGFESNDYMEIEVLIQDL